MTTHINKIESNTVSTDNIRWQTICITKLQQFQFPDDKPEDNKGVNLDETREGTTIPNDIIQNLTKPGGNNYTWRFCDALEENTKWQHPKWHQGVNLVSNTKWQPIQTTQMTN
jgi:hypothetical protein